MWSFFNLIVTGLLKFSLLCKISPCYRVVYQYGFPRSLFCQFSLPKNKVQRERSAFIILSRIKGQFKCPFKYLYIFIFKYNAIKNAEGKKRSVERRVCSWLTPGTESGHPSEPPALPPPQQGLPLVGLCLQSCDCGFYCSLGGGKKGEGVTWKKSRSLEGAPLRYGCEAAGWEGSWLRWVPLCSPIFELGGHCEALAFHINLCGWMQAAFKGL